MHCDLSSATGQKCSQFNPNVRLSRRDAPAAIGNRADRVDVDFARWIAGANRARCVAAGFFALRDEFSAEFATDPPCQPTLARLAGRENDGEFRGNFRIFSDDLDAARGHVRDRAIARQGAGPELNLRDPLAVVAFAAASIHQHVDPAPHSVDLDFPPLLAKKDWKLPSRTARNLSIPFEFLLPSCFDTSREAATTVIAADVPVTLTCLAGGHN